MDKIELWIKRKLASAVAAGIGQWADSPESDLGKPIYHVEDGSIALVLLQFGFKYKGQFLEIFECRYDEVEAINFARLREVMLSRGDLRKTLSIEVMLRDAPAPFKMQLPLRVYSQVVAVFSRIVNELE